MINGQWSPVSFIALKADFNPTLQSVFRRASPSWTRVRFFDNHSIHNVTKWRSKKATDCECSLLIRHGSTECSELAQSTELSQWSVHYMPRIRSPHNRRNLCLAVSRVTPTLPLLSLTQCRVQAPGKRWWGPPPTPRLVICPRLHCDVEHFVLYTPVVTDDDGRCDRWCCCCWQQRIQGKNTLADRLRDAAETRPVTADVDIQGGPIKTAPKFTLRSV